MKRPPTSEQFACRHQYWDLGYYTLARAGE